MKLQTLMIGLLAFGLACTGFAKANDFGCSNSNVQCQTIAGPGSIEIKDVVGAGVGFCQGNQSLPLSCTAVNSGDIQGAGAAVFDLSTHDSANPATDSVSVWIHYNNQLPCDALAPVCGFSALIGNDRNLDGTATNIGNQSDQLFNIYSDTSVDPGCPDKDNKNCGVHSDDAQGTFCFKRVDSDLDPVHWADGQALVFIGAWVGVTPSLAGGNIGAGISIGTYTVELKDNNATCTPGGTTQTGSCLWEDDAVSETLVASSLDIGDATDDLQGTDGDTAVDAVEDISGAVTVGATSGTGHCDNGADGTPNLDCTGASVIVVFAVGAPTTVTSTTGCAGALSAGVVTVPPIINANTATGTGTFTCSWVWNVVGVGGCLAF